MQGCRHADGGNLYLTISKTGAGVSRRWTFIYSLAGKQREAGFGPAAVVPLAEAREKAAHYRSMLAKGIDPLAAKKAAREAEAGRRTFGECAAELIKSKSSEWRNEKHRQQWSSTLHDYCGTIRDVPVDTIDTAAVLSVLQPIWGWIPETSSRLRGRIEAVLIMQKLTAFDLAKTLRPGAGTWPLRSTHFATPTARAGRPSTN